MKVINTGPLSLRSPCTQQITQVTRGSEGHTSMKVLLEHRRKPFVFTGRLREGFTEKLTFVSGLAE